MTMLLGKWTSVLQVLILVSRDPDPTHRDCAKWAVLLIDATSGAKGFCRMTCFAVECDFFVNGSEVVKFHDADKSRASMSQAAILSALERAEALFAEGFIFSSEPNFSYTYQWLHGIKQAKGSTIYFGKDCSKVAVVGFAIDSKFLQRPMKFAASLYDILKQAVSLYFPVTRGKPNSQPGILAQIVCRSRFAWTICRRSLPKRDTIALRHDSNSMKCLRTVSRSVSSLSMEMTTKSGQRSLSDSE